jgi:hypothetical protein
VHGVKGYHHTNLLSVQVVNPVQPRMVYQSVPVVTKVDECVLQHSREPRAIQACGTQSPILGEVKVREIIQLHLKYRHNNVTNPL